MKIGIIYNKQTRKIVEYEEITNSSDLKKRFNELRNSKRIPSYVVKDLDYIELPDKDIAHLLDSNKLEYYINHIYSKNPIFRRTY